MRHVGAEDAAEAVQLVDDDVPQPHEEGGPTPVVRQDADVQHVRVGQHDVGVTADPCPHVRIRVAVVGGGHDPGRLERGQAAELVLREGLRGEQEQRGTRRIAGGRFRNGKLVAEGLPRRRARRQREGTAGSCRVDGCGLVGPQGAGGTRAGQRKRERRVERRDLCGSGPQTLDVHELSAIRDAPQDGLEVHERTVTSSQRGGLRHLSAVRLRR